MKIAVRGGHNFSVQGASDIINETKEDRKVKDALIKYLRCLGHTVIDVTSSDDYNTIMSDLRYGVDKANNNDVDLFISCHFDCIDGTVDYPLGHAVWIYGENSKSYPIAKRIVDNVSNNTGFKNRGVRFNPSLYELRHTNMPSMIIETCFVNSHSDVDTYKKVGFDEIGRLIACGVDGGDIASSKPITPSEPTKPNTSDYIPICDGIYKDYEEHGTCTVNTSLNIRTLPTTNSDVVGQYNSGESVVYDHVYLSDKYVWISWIGVSGNRRYMAIKDKLNNTRWGNCV